MVGCEEDGYSCITSEAPLDLDVMAGNTEFTDFRGNQFVKPGDKRFGKTYLTLGDTG